MGTAEPALDAAYFRSVDYYEGELLLGSSQSEIVTFNTDSQSLHWITRGHAEGELWGVARHPTEKVAATASDDKSLRVWDLEQRELRSITFLDYAARSCVFSHDCAVIAVGMKSGQVQLFSSETFESVKLIQDRKQARHCCSFSPDGEKLAVGSNDNVVDVYDVTKDYEHVATCKKGWSFITQIDWSTCS